jgi:cell division protein FtsB
MRIVFGIFSLAAIVAIVFLGLSLKDAHDESEHWKTRRATLENELLELRKEVEEHGAFLDRLRRDPDFQDAMARKELGYGKSGELNFRFPKEEANLTNESAEP